MGFSRTPRPVVQTPAGQRESSPFAPRPFAAPRISPPPEQRVAQRVIKAQKTGVTTVSDLGSLGAIFTNFALDAEGKKGFATEFKDQLFAGTLFPDAYKAEFATSAALKAEVGEIIKGVSSLIADSTSGTVITAAANEGTSVARQLFAIIGSGITVDKLNGYEHYKATKGGLDAPAGTTYIKFIDEMQAKLKAYAKLIDKKKFDKETRKTNERMENRVSLLQEKFDGLKEELAEAEGDDIAEVITKMQSLRDEIGIEEKVWDIDLAAGDKDVAKELTKLQDDTAEHNIYKTGGIDDGVSVDDEYSALKACSLFALLALRPGWMGAESPLELHTILRKTKDLKNYDDDITAAKIRYMAGLKPTMTAGKRLDAYINEIFAAGDARPSFIVDPLGAAHTFAAIWDGGKYVPRDNEAAADTNIMGITKWKKITMGSVWK